MNDVDGTDCRIPEAAEIGYPTSSRSLTFVMRLALGIGISILGNTFAGTILRSSVEDCWLAWRTTNVKRLMMVILGRLRCILLPWNGNIAIIKKQSTKASSSLRYWMCLFVVISLCILTFLLPLLESRKLQLKTASHFSPVTRTMNIR